MAKSITNVKVGVCDVSWNSVDLGHTKGGCTITYTPDWYEITVDEYGTTPADAVLKGERITVTVPLAESQLANLKVAMPVTDDNTDNLTIGSTVGAKASTYAKQLVLHPIEATDISDDIIIYKALSIGEVVQDKKIDAETIITVTFLALIDESKSNLNLLAMFGDSTPT